MADRRDDQLEVPAREKRDLHAAPPLTMRELQSRARWIVPAAAGTFLVLAVLAAVNALPWDRPITQWIADHRTAGLNNFWRSVTQLGGDQVAYVVAACCAALAWPRCRPLAIAIVTLALTRSILVFSLKEIVARDRPPAALAITHPGGYSFPSGHPFAVAASWGFIPLVIALYTRRPWVWWTSVVVVWSLVIMIAASRVYLGAHYTTDVIATLLLAVVFIAGSELLIAYLHRRNSQSPLACGIRNRRS